MPVTPPARSRTEPSTALARSGRGHRATHWLAAAMLVAMAGCSGTASDEPPPTPTTGASSASTPSDPDTPSTPSTPAATTSVGPDVVQDRLDFVLGLLNGDELDEADYTSSFAQPFREQVPFSAFVEPLARLQQGQPWRLGTEQSRDASSVAATVVGADGNELVVELTVDDSGMIDGLLLRPGQQPMLDDPVTSLDDATARLQELGELRLVAATVEDTTCTPDAGVATDDLGPVGSIAKLWVLAAVVDAIDAGTIGWGDELTITDDVRSLPSGILQDEPSDTTVTVRRAAELMISISDNTATDLLIAAIGRDAVEDALGSWGHQTPAATIPFPTTRELFQLKAAPDEVRTRWVQGDATQRRAVLAEVADDPLPDVDAFTADPVQPDQVEWFASPMDVCRVLAGLHARLDEPGLEPLTSILTANPGVAPPPDRWTRVLFKGGSEPGLIATAWLVEDQDGTTRALVGSVLDPARPLDEATAVLLLAGARDQLPSD